jgi:hypothetical protein
MNLALLVLSLTEAIACFFWVFKTDFIFVEEVGHHCLLGGTHSSIQHFSFKCFSFASLGWGLDLVVGGVELGVTLDEFVHLLALFSCFGFLLSVATTSHLILELLFEHHYLILAVGVLKIIVVGHIQPGVLQHLLSGCTSLMVPGEHGQQKVRQHVGFLLLDAVLFNQHLLQGPVVQALDSPQVTLGIEEFAGVLARQSQVLWHSAEELHHLGEMIVVLVVVLTLTGFEEEVTGDHLEDGTCKRPNVSRGVVVGADNDFRRSVLSGLNLGRKVMVSPASISHIANLDHYLGVQLSSSLAKQFLLLFILLLHFFDGLFREPDFFHTLFRIVLLSRLRWLILLLGRSFDFNVNIVTVNIFHAVLLALSFGRGLDLRAIKGILLLSLALQLLPQVLLLLFGETFKQFAVPDFLVCSLTLEVALVFFRFGNILFLLQGAGNFHIHVLDVIVVAHLCGRQLACSVDFMHFLVSETDNDVFRLEVGVDHLAHPVHVV